MIPKGQGVADSPDGDRLDRQNTSLSLLLHVPMTYVPRP